MATLYHNSQFLWYLCCSTGFPENSNTHNFNVSKSGVFLLTPHRFILSWKLVKMKYWVHWLPPLSPRHYYSVLQWSLHSQRWHCFLAPGLTICDHCDKPKKEIVELFIQRLVYLNFCVYNSKCLMTYGSYHQGKREIISFWGNPCSSKKVIFISVDQEDVIWKIENGTYCPLIEYILTQGSSNINLRAKNPFFIYWKIRYLRLQWSTTLLVLQLPQIQH